jgi:hypothetical protein
VPAHARSWPDAAQRTTSGPATAASAFDLIKIDIGPGRSLIVEHRRAARPFIHGLQKAGLSSAVDLVYCGL